MFRRHVLPLVMQPGTGSEEEKVSWNESRKRKLECVESKIFC